MNAPWYDEPVSQLLSVGWPDNANTIKVLSLAF
jgi:hypothetical protein